MGSIDESGGQVSKSDEIWAFLFLAVFLAPATAIALVGSYGFTIWIFQLITG